MTPDDKRRLAALRARYRGLQGDMPPFGDVITLLRLLDQATAERDAIYEAAGNHENQAKEAEAERDAAMAALRERDWHPISDLPEEHHHGAWVRAYVETGALYCPTGGEATHYLLFPAHSAATKSPDPVEKEGSDG